VSQGQSPSPSQTPSQTPSRSRIITASWVGTVVLAAASIGAVVSSSTAVRAAALAVDLAMFTGGAVVFLWAYAIAVSRSRTDEIGIGGLYFLAGSAPKDVRVNLLGSLAAQVVVALIAASVKPFTSVAFAVLALLWGLGLAGLWAARHGTFPARATKPKPAADDAPTQP
jgi:hypothetical protein